MTNIDDIMGQAEAQNFDALGAVTAIYTDLAGTEINIKILLDDITTRKDFDGTGEIEFMETDGVILKDTNSYGTANPQIGGKITIGANTWLIIAKHGETTFDTTVSLRCDIPKNKQFESRIKRLK